MKKLTDNERHVLSMIGMVDRDLEILGKIIVKSEEEIKEMVKSINKKRGEIIKKNKETGLYYATPEAKKIFGDDFFNELKGMKRE